jgi:hypothetical protein
MFVRRQKNYGGCEDIFFGRRMPMIIHYSPLCKNTVARVANNWILQNDLSLKSFPGKGVLPHQFVEFVEFPDCA